MKEYEFDRLPELPLALFEMAGRLDLARDAPFLTVIHDEMEPPEPPPTAAVESLAEFYVREYLSQVFYPRVVCYPRGELVDRVALKPVDTGEDQQSLEVTANRTAYFKLTSLRGEQFRFGYFCTVHYGPWSAVVREEESCLAGVPSQWRMFVASIPDLQLAWFGEWDDVPSYPNLTVLTGDLHLVAEARACCPGFRWCAATNSCVPDQISVDCGDISPV